MQTITTSPSTLPNVFYLLFSLSLIINHNNLMMCLNITYLLVISFTYIIINSFLKTSITLYYVHTSITFYCLSVCVRGTWRTNGVRSRSRSRETPKLELSMYTPFSQESVAIEVSTMEASICMLFLEDSARYPGRTRQDPEWSSWCQGV